MGAEVWLQFGLGLVLLFAGGEALVRGSARLARQAGVSPLVIGLTVVAFGTSAPELVVSTSAALAGRDDVALGNVVGSNIFNVLFVLGSCALIRPLVVAQQLVWRDVPILIGLSVGVLLLSLDGRISTAEGAILAIGLAVFTVYTIRASRRETAAIREEYDAGVPAERGARRWPIDVAFVAAGLGLLVLGGRAMVASAVEIAVAFGLSETVIALTIVSVGTSLPEVAASLVATFRGERDIAAGNAIGSSIFNLLGILGVAAVAGGGLTVAPALESFDLPVMTATAVACLPIMARGHQLARWEGALFLAYYAAYTAYLVLAAQHHAALPRYSAVMLEFVVPLTVATFAVVWLRARRRERG